MSIAKICDAGRFGPDANQSEDTLQTQAGELLKNIDRELV